MVDAGVSSKVLLSAGRMINTFIHVRCSVVIRTPASHLAIFIVSLLNNGKTKPRRDERAQLFEENSIMATKAENARTCNKCYDNVQQVLQKSKIPPK